MGTWALRSIRVTYRNGKVNDHPYGPHGKSILIFEENGHFAHILTNPDVPKYASNLIGKPTTEEAVAAHGTFAFFGTYSVDEAKKSFTFHIDDKFLTIALDVCFSKKESNKAPFGSAHTRGRGCGQPLLTPRL